MRNYLSAAALENAVSAGIGARNVLIGVATAAVTILAILLPLPPLLLDLLLALSLGAAAGVLLVALATADPLKLTSMPPVLVLTSLLRIILCLCVGRLILMGGGEGTLVASLGTVAGGADAVVAVGLLVILAVVHVVMVTGGVGRMAEVAARFALDALPGKQMGLDTAVGAGHLAADEAREEVRRLEAEAGFYGAMDGAGRLLRGEAVATIVIVALTAVIGAARAVGSGMQFAEAASLYATLATGQGLVTLLPALVMGAAAALMVSRAAGGSSLVEEIGEQMLAGPWPLIAAAIVLISLGAFPGVAATPTLIGGALLGLAAFWISRIQSGTPSSPGGPQGRKRPPELSLELGMGLLELAEDSEGLMAMLFACRRRLSTELGFGIPPITVRDSLELGPTEFALVFRAGRLASGIVRPGRILAVAPHAGVTPDAGHPAELPDGRHGVWTTPEEAQNLADIGFDLMSPAQALIEHVRTTLVGHAFELFDLERAAALFEELAGNHPALASAAEQEGLTLSLFHGVCRELLWQGVPLRDPVSIEEGIVDAMPEIQDPEGIALRVRPLLSGMIADCLMTDDRIRAVTVARELHDELAEGAHREDGRTVAAMMPAREAAWVDLLDQIGTEHGWGEPLAVIAETRSVLVLQSLCRRTRSRLLAVRATDLAPDGKLTHVASLEPSQLAEGPS